MDHNRRQLLNRFGLVRHAVLQSPRDPQQRVHVVYGWDSTDFVLTQLTQKLETRAGLRLVLPDKGDISLSGEESPFFAALQWCRQTLVISGDAWAEGNALYQAVKETVHPLGQTVFIQRCCRCPDWVSELEICTVMVYPRVKVYTSYHHERDFLFWSNLSLLLETSDMDHKRRQLLNRFGLVRHAVLQPSRGQQQGVHVVYDGDSSDFVLTQLTQELETQAGLRLVLPDMGDISLSGEESPLSAALLGCRQTLIISYVSPDKAVYQAVKEVEHPVGQTVFILRGGRCPDWVSELETCTVMVYPRDESQREAEFWDQLKSILETFDIDHKRRQLLNRFGLVRHAVLQSSRDPQQGVHVVYGWDSTDFVLTQLTLELEARAGLRLVLPDKGDISLSGEESPFFAALQGCRQTLIVSDEDRAVYKALYQAVKEAGHPLGQTVFIQRGRRCPDWVSELETCTVMVYPRGQRVEEAEFWYTMSWILVSPCQTKWTIPTKPDETSAVKQLSGSACELHGESSEVIDLDTEPTEKGRVETLTSLTVSYSSQPRIESSPQLHGSKAAQSTLLLQTDKVSTPTSEQQSSEAERRQTAAAEIKRWQQDRDNVSDNDDTGDEWEMCSSGSSVSSMSSYVSMEMTDPLTTADTDSPLFSYPSRLSRSDADLSRPAAVATITKRSFADICNTDTLPSSKSSAGRRRQLRHTLKAKVADENPLNTLAVGLEKLAADCHEFKDVPSPICSRSWQAVFSVSTAGGTLRNPGSDVMIEVPAGAVDDALAVHTAVCTDTDRVARVLGLQGGESVCSPLAEYWAGHDFYFRKPVRITLPHFLPPNPDPRLVRVYRLTGRPDGHIAITRLRQQPASGTHCTVSRHPDGGDISMSQSRPTEGRQAGRLNTEEHCPASGQTRQVTLEAPVAEDTDNRDVLWEDTATFQMTSDYSIFVTTDGFSGYVCTYCGHRKPPVLNLMACGGYTGDEGGHQTAQISVHVWDGRLHIRDFRQDYGIAVLSHILTSNTLDVIPDLPDSRLYIRFSLGRHCDEDWQLSLDVSDQAQVVRVPVQHDVIFSDYKSPGDPNCFVAI